MRRLLLSLLLLATACASSSGPRPSDIAAPDIRMRPASSIRPGMQARVPIDVDITNNATVPLRVRKIEVRPPAPGMMQYDIRRKAQSFHETIAPGRSRTLRLVITMDERQQSLSRGALGILAIIHFEANRRGFQEVIMDRFEGSGR